MITPELHKEINDLLLTIVSAVAAGLLPALALLVRLAWKLARAWVDAKIAALQKQEIRDALEFAMKRIDLTVETVVQEIEQTSAKRGMDGKILDPAKLAMAAVSRVKNRLPKEAMETLNANYAESDFLRMILGKVESKVGQRKWYQPECRPIPSGLTPKLM